MRIAAGVVLGIVLGLIAAPVCGAVVGGLFGSPWLIEPSHVDPGLQGMIAGMVMYGMGLCIPMALVGGIIGGIVGAKRGHSLRPRPDKGGHVLNPDAPEQGAPANRPRE